MSRIRLTIDHLGLRGLDQVQRSALVAGLARELERALDQAARRPGQARALRTPVLRLQAPALGAGAAAARALGTSIARTIAGKLRP